MYGKKGEIKGAMLDDGTFVRLPKHAAYQFAVQLQPVAVEDLGTQNEYGRAIEAIAIGASARACVVGVLAGVLPAMQASEIQPCLAIKQE